MAQKSDWRRADIESLLLYLTSQRPMYGYQIIKELEARSRGYFKFKEGTLYPVLYRLERAGLMEGKWQTLASGRQRKYYHITDRGLVVVAERQTQWQAFLTAMNLIIQPWSA